MKLFKVVSMTLLLLLVSLLGVTAVEAQQRGPNHIAARLIAESSAPAAGSEVTLAILMTPEPGWHGYWRNPGDAGVETKVEWQLPGGVNAGPLRYPVPHRLLISGLMNYVYEGPYAQLVTLTLPAGLAKGTELPIAARLQYLACTDRICVPEQADVALRLTVGDGVPDRRAEFDGFRRAQPRPLGSNAMFELSDGRLRMAIPLPRGVAVDDPYFFPITRELLNYAAVQTVTRRDDFLVLEAEADRSANVSGPIEGVLKIGEEQGLSIRAVPGAVGPAGKPLEAGTAAIATGDWLTIGGVFIAAVLGGLILNVMPCVFPILSLKVLSLARAGGEERGARSEALAYTTGVILTCLALGGVLLALRSGGAAVGWAFQLQDPRSIIVLLLLVGAITLNLAGLFELPAVSGGADLAGKSGTTGAFWTGALAAFVATPCTGPFMGAALGAALVLPPAAALAIFAGLGLGLALPFLLLGLVPALRRKLPRPGPWMQRLRHALAIPMALTAAALAYVLVQQAGTEGLLLGLGALLLLALCLWAIGRRQHGGGSAGWVWLVPAVATGVGAVLLVPVGSSSSSRPTTRIAGAEPFSETRLASLQAEGRPVFLYFTADWCLTCKVNEKAVIERQEVVDAFERSNVAVLVGDWTNGDPAITRFLEKHGRSGVPLYLFYAPGKPVQVLPQLLTTGMVTGLAA